MPKRNKIEMQNLVERIVKMFYEEKKSQLEITEILKSEGFDVSKSGVGRTLVSHASQMKAYRNAAKEAVEIVKELKDSPGLEIAEATTQLLQTKLLQEVKKFSSFETLEVKDVLKAANQNAMTQARIAKIKLDYAKGYRQGLFKAADVIEEEGKKAGLSEETLAIIKAKITGQKVPDGDTEEE